ncbi:uncharacterized protein LOC135488715 [Lineus longissimus]|uniref:uncharacterized protein LOC135488715 n=1 Tax=Lineus longissimus TaxID=88925 RepID=UPI00315D09F2
MADVRAALHRLQNVEVTRVPCCTPEVAEKPLNRGVFFVDLSQLSRSIDAVIMTDRENGETGIAPYDLYSKSNPGLLKIDVTNPREWYKNGEKILTTVYDKNAGQRSNGRQSLESGVRSNGGLLLLPSVHNRRKEVSPEHLRNKLDKGRSGGAKVFPSLNHVTAVRYTSEPSLNALDMNGNTDGDVGNVDSWADMKENVPDEDQFFEKRNGLPFLKNGGHHSNGTVSDSEFEGVVFYHKKRQTSVARTGYRSGRGKSLGKSNNLYPKQRSILHDTINFEQYKLKQKSILKLKFPEADPNQKAKPRPYAYGFQHSVPVEPDYSHIQSKIGCLIRPHGKTAVPEEASAPLDAPADTDVSDYSPRGYTPNVKYSFGLDILIGDELPVAASTPSIKEGHYVYKAPGDGYYQRSISHDGTRTAIVNLALGKDVQSTPSEAMTRPFLKGRYRRRKVDSGYTSSTPATEYSSWDERSILDYETDEESRSKGHSRANGAGTATCRYANLKSAGSFKSNLGVKDTENGNDFETSGDHHELGTDVYSPTRLDSPSKKSVRFSHAEAVKADGLISPSKLGLPRTPGTASGRPKSVLKKFNKIEVFGEKGNKKTKHDEEGFRNSDKTVVKLAKPRYTPATRPPVYKLDRPKSVSHDDSSSEKLNSKSGDEDDEYMTRVACPGSPTESKMVEIVESYRRYLDQGDSEDPAPKRAADADGTKLDVKMSDAEENAQTHLGQAQGDVPAEAEKTASAPQHAQSVPVGVEARQQNEVDAFSGSLLRYNSKERTNNEKNAEAKSAEEGRQIGLEPSGNGEEARVIEQTTPAVSANNKNPNAKECNEIVDAARGKNGLGVADISTSDNDQPVAADQPVVTDQLETTDQQMVSDQPVVSVDEGKTTGQAELTEVTGTATADEANVENYGITPQNEQTIDNNDGAENDVRDETAMATDREETLSQGKSAVTYLENKTGDDQTGQENESLEDSNGNI